MGTVYQEEIGSTRTEMDHTEQKNRILLAGPTPPPMGGIIRYGQDILSSPLAQKYEIVFFPSSIPAQLRPNLQMSSKTWNIFKRDGLKNGLLQIAWGWKRAGEMKELLKQESFDIVHIPTCTGWGFWRSALHVHYAKASGAKVLFHLLGAIDVFWYNGSRLRRFFIRKSLNMADVNVVQSDGLRDITSSFTTKPVLSIYNGVRTSQLIPEDGYAHSDPAEDRIRVITIGTLGYGKGTFLLIEAGKELCSQIPNLEFVLVGGGRVDYVRGLVADRGLTDRFVITGQIDDEEKVKLLKKSDIFVLPSYNEGQPISILEAMAAGLPIISSAVGSIPEIIWESNGRLIQPGDISKLKEFIRELASSPQLRHIMGRQNAEEAEEKFSLDRTMTELGRVYQDLINKRI